MGLFALGRTVCTPAALQVLNDSSVSPFTLLQRHVNGNYGELGKEDIRANKLAIEFGDRILSRYKVGGEDFYVITEADRSSTCLLLCSEY